MVYSDRSFGRNEDSSSQFRNMMFMTVKYYNAILIGYTSIKSRGVFRSVLGEKKFALADACDTAIIIPHGQRHILGNPLKSRS